MKFVFLRTQSGRRIFVILFPLLPFARGDVRRGGQRGFKNSSLEDPSPSPPAWGVRVGAGLQTHSTALRACPERSRMGQAPVRNVSEHMKNICSDKRVIIDLGRGSFAHGQTYVTLSRCTSLEGIVLRRPFRRSDVIMDRRVEEFGR